MEWKGPWTFESSNKARDPHGGRRNTYEAHGVGLEAKAEPIRFCLLSDIPAPLPDLGIYPRHGNSVRKDGDARHTMKILSETDMWIDLLGDPCGMMVQGYILRQLSKGNPIR
jgi:hypothetical protein